MFPQKKPPPPYVPPGPPHSMIGPGSEGFDVDLREALASTSVREMSFEEFRRALDKQGRLKSA